MQTSQHCNARPSVNAASAMMAHSFIDEHQCDIDSDETDSYVANADSVVTDSASRETETDSGQTETDVQAGGPAIATESYKTANCDVLAVELTIIIIIIIIIIKIFIVRLLQ
jgi:hypothetical protein